VFALLPEGKLLAGGFDHTNGFLTRLTPTGALDPGFNAQLAGEVPQQLLPTSDGRMIAVTMHPDPNGTLSVTNPLIVMRLRSDGSVDPTFRAFHAAAVWFPPAIASQTDGRLVLAGNFLDYGDQGAYAGVIRLNPDGTRDTSFGPGGQ
jgi:uncharacterized delta-60 repeat protein